MIDNLDILVLIVGLIVLGYIITSNMKFKNMDNMNIQNFQDDVVEKYDQSSTDKEISMDIINHNASWENSNDENDDTSFTGGSLYSLNNVISESENDFLDFDSLN